MMAHKPVNAAKLPGNTRKLIPCLAFTNGAAAAFDSGFQQRGAKTGTLYRRNRKSFWTDTELVTERAKQSVKS